MLMLWGSLGGLLGILGVPVGALVGPINGFWEVKRDLEIVWGLSGDLCGILGGPLGLLGGPLGAPYVEMWLWQLPGEIPRGGGYQLN